MINFFLRTGTKCQDVVYICPMIEAIPYIEDEDQEVEVDLDELASILEEVDIILNKDGEDLFK